MDVRRRAKGKLQEQRVVEAAARAISERGLSNVRIADIAERAGISSGHVTYYFRSKSVLLMEAIRWSEEQFHSTVVEELRSLNDPWDKLGRLIEAGAPAGPGDLGWVLWLDVWANAALNENVARISDELEGWWLDALSDVISLGQDEKKFNRELPARELAVRLSAMIDGLSVRVTLGSKGMTRERMLATCEDVARKTLRADAPH